MQLHFLSGLPRSGSTLLTSLLYQNPAIHTEGLSGLCDLMWVAQQSLSSGSVDANHRRDHADQMIRQLPEMYYSNISRPVVIDKCRRWTTPPNVEMLRRYATPTPKIICSVRDLGEIVTSFGNLCERNGQDFNGSLFEETMHGDIQVMEYAKAMNDPDTYHFVEYDDLCAAPQEMLNGIYDFLELPRFAHQFTDITNPNQEDDSVYGLAGMHDVRPTIGKLCTVSRVG